MSSRYQKIPPRVSGRAVSGTACPSGELGRDVESTPITVGARVEQTGVNAEWGALHSRLGKQGTALGRSATMLVVRFEGDTALTRIRPHLVRVVNR